MVCEMCIAMKIRVPHQCSKPCCRIPVNQNSERQPVNQNSSSSLHVQLQFTPRASCERELAPDWSRTKHPVRAHPYEHALPWARNQIFRFRFHRSLIFCLFSSIFTHLNTLMGGMRQHTSRLRDVACLLLSLEVSSRRFSRLRLENHPLETSRDRKRHATSLRGEKL